MSSFKLDGVVADDFHPDVTMYYQGSKPVAMAMKKHIRSPQHSNAITLMSIFPMAYEDALDVFERPTVAHHADMVRGMEQMIDTINGLKEALKGCTDPKTADAISKAISYAVSSAKKREESADSYMREILHG